MKRVRIVVCLVVMVLELSPAFSSGFILRNNDHLDVTYHFEFDTGVLWDSSSADVRGGAIGCAYINDYATLNVLNYGTSGTSVGYAYAYNNSIVNLLDGGISAFQAWNSSTVNISGGSIMYSGSEAHDSSTVNITGGSITGYLQVWESSTLNISGGSITGNYLAVLGNSITNISGGSVDGLLYAHESSTVIFNGYDFELGNGLFWDIGGQTILGTGILKGKWFDNTNFEIDIYTHESAATIMAIPEPATILLLSLGGLFLRKRSGK